MKLLEIENIFKGDVATVYQCSEETTNTQAKIYEYEGGEKIVDIFHNGLMIMTFRIPQYKGTP